MEVRTKTGQQTIDTELKTYREKDDFVGLGMSSVWTTSAYHSMTASTVLAGASYNRGPGRPRANWRSIVIKNLRKMGFIWEEAKVAALDRQGCRRSVAQCVQLDTGWNKVKVKIWEKWSVNDTKFLGIPFQVFFQFKKSFYKVSVLTRITFTWCHPRIVYKHCLKNGPILKRYSSKLYGSILTIFGKNIQRLQNAVFM